MARVTPLPKRDERVPEIRTPGPSYPDERVPESVLRALGEKSGFCRVEGGELNCPTRPTRRKWMARISGEGLDGDWGGGEDFP